MTPTGFLKSFVLFVLANVAVQSGIVAQLTVRQDRTPEEMIKEIVPGKGVVIKNVRYAGMPAALGEFAYPDAKKIFASGIVMSTGKASDMAAANTNPKTSTVNGSTGDKNLYALAGGRTFDAAVLDFDFMADKDSLAFSFLFASEEYHDYVGSTFNDAFAIVITGPGMPAGKNFAVLPGTTQPITVNSINPNQNRQFYVDNNPFNLVGKINEQVKAGLNQDVLNNFSFDGMSKVFSVGCRIQPKQIYHFQMSIADAGDGTVDSAVLLEGNSLKSLEQSKHELRRQLIAAQRREDSLARVKVVEDSLRMVAEIKMLRDKLVQDSISRVKEHIRDSIARANPPAELPKEEQPEIQQADSAKIDKSENEPEILELSDNYQPRDPEEEGPRFLDLDLILFEGLEFELSPSDKVKVQEYGKKLAENRSRKLALYFPEGDPQDVRNQRFDAIHLALVQAGARPSQIFMTPVGHSSSKDVHRVEIWLSEQ